MGSRPGVERCFKGMSGLIGILTAGLLLMSTALSAAQFEFELSIDEVSISVAPGMDYKVFGFNQQVPGPLMHVREGDDVTVNVTNNTSLPHTIHWHGLYHKDNWRNDGVPGITQHPIEAGDSFTYKWKADKPGTMWYHCHVNVNEHVGIRGMWGPIVIDPKNPQPREGEVTKEVIMMLSGWESEFADKYGKGGTPADVTDHFSINAKSFPMTQPIRVKKGDKMRIRFIGAGGEIHSMHTHGHDMLITHKDGLPLSAPYAVDTILFGPGERYDAFVDMNNSGRFIFHDHVDRHVVNGDKFPGGAITVIEYEGNPDDDWYAWKGVKYQPDFFFSESMKKGYGMFNNPDFVGKPLARERRRPKK